MIPEYISWEAMAASSLLQYRTHGLLTSTRRIVMELVKLERYHRMTFLASFL